MLGNLINLNRYMCSVCDGIYSFCTNNKKQIDIDKIKWIYDYLSDENKQLLRAHISFTNNNK
jgi:hypothetical protein